MTQPPVLLGIDFGGSKIAAAVCGLSGDRLASAAVDSLGARGARASFEHGVATAAGLLAAHAAGAAVVAVGVSTFGIPFDDRVELAPAIDGWERLALAHELRRAFPGAAITMGTDTKAAARAEARWGALADCDPAVYLNLGTGLAAAIVTGGRVLSGRHGAAGEIGYSLREPGDVGLAPGERILLEDMVSGQALQRRASLRQASLAGSRAQRHRATAAAVFAAAASDADLNGLITEFVDELAFHVVNLAIVVNPARIAVGGGITGSWDRIRPRLEQALLSAVPYPPELVLARFPHEAPLLGAVALAVDAAGEATSHTGNQPIQPIDSSTEKSTGRYGTNCNISTNSVSIPAPIN